ncbi:hypothetical protein [Jannaschia pohangensis]|uniref:Uncharacterized protein n=1 Tax=Jannaschia pohangensis TaxID=390807 RepID=A0A1I3I5R7_9RHOB|nr:hypothetical protein [Jannaschia pohangensis]SFI43272.1 hypothetical protein SAMN04488095_0825 [Jannaschia pohangensis]
MSDNGPRPNPDPTPPFYKSLLGIWLIGAGVLFFFMGLVWAILWSVAFGVFVLFRVHILAGIAAALVAIAIFVAQPFLDDTVWERQLAAAPSMEIDRTPIDLTGKSILFVGGSTFRPLMCRLLCQNIALCGPAGAA